MHTYFDWYKFYICLVLNIKLILPYLLFTLNNNDVTAFYLIFHLYSYSIKVPAIVFFFCFSLLPAPKIYKTNERWMKQGLYINICSEIKNYKIKRKRKRYIFYNIWRKRYNYLTNALLIQITSCDIFQTWNRILSTSHALWTLDP